METARSGEERWYLADDLRAAATNSQNRRTPPMQNNEEPFHLVPCRFENDKIARVLCMTAGVR